MAVRHRQHRVRRMMQTAVGIALPTSVDGATTADAVALEADREPKGDPILCPVDELLVPENAGSGVVSEWLRYQETLQVEPLGDEIWAGVWFTGRNGPEGWPGTSAPSYYPLPGAPEYSLIARLGNGPYQYVGRTPRSFTNTQPGYLLRVRFRVNDNVPGNGNGAFKVFLRYPCH